MYTRSFLEKRVSGFIGNSRAYSLAIHIVWQIVVDRVKKTFIFSFVRKNVSPAIKIFGCIRRDIHLNDSTKIKKRLQRSSNFLNTLFKLYNKNLFTIIINLMNDFDIDIDY